MKKDYFKNKNPADAKPVLGVVLLPEETIEEAASRLWIQCYPNWLNNGKVIKKAVARDYAKMIVNGIIKETLDEYTNDENHVRVEFWRKVLIHLDEAVFLPDFKGEKETCIRWDRTRTTNYNGEGLNMNSYSCSTCKNDYKFEERSHKFCPFCGNEYKYETDVSV